MELFFEKYHNNSKTCHNRHLTNINHIIIETKMNSRQHNKSSTLQIQKTERFVRQ